MAAEGGATGNSDSCAVCGLATKKQCSGCKMVKYCSKICQIYHWNSEHKTKCKRTKPSIPMVPTGGRSKFVKQSNKILFPYEEFVRFFNWTELRHPPCGLINSGNSCFANVVLQCLTYTRPLVAYLVDKGGHRANCQMDKWKWCLLCAFQKHVERADYSHTPFSPLNILTQLHLIGGDFRVGKQEDSHEFMSFVIGTMQSACLDEYGGETAVHPRYQETTIIQHIFGGRTQSQVTCKECDNVSDKFENMMDLSVEIHEDVVSLEDCLHLFTAEETLDGDNKYKCDRCNDYVVARKWIAPQLVPNILTITLKRFKSGRFGKINKMITFPETLDFRFFVSRVDLAKVLSQTAYMLLYSRIRLLVQENENVDL